MSRTNPQLADRYADALLALADESGATDHLADDLAGLREALSQDAALAAQLASPALSRQQQAAAVAALAARAHLNPLTGKLLGVLARNWRLAALPAIAGAYAARLATRRGEQSVTVTTAKPLTEGERQKLIDRLSGQLGRKIAVETNVNPAILGGIVIATGSRVVDASLKRHLDRLAVALKGAA